MRRLLPCAALAIAACSSNPISTATGEFNSPTGIAATSAGDRDLLFIANSGRDSLRALQICNHPLLTDGGVDPADTCPSNQNFQFVPAPIRVFPANVETGNRPLHVAGARLTRTDGIPAGVALSVGVDSTVAIVDSYALVQHPDGGVPLQADGGPAPLVTQLDVQAQAVDVAAANPLNSRLIETAAAAGSTVTAYVVTLAPELVWLDVGLDAGNLPHVSVHARCTLEAGTVPSRIAVPPGSDADVYIADLGPAGGVIHVPKSGIAGGACASNRIGAAGRRVRSVAASPTWFQSPGNDTDPDIVHPAGEILMMVLEPLACSGTGPDCASTAAGIDLDPGGVLFARTTDGTILPVPPFDILATGAPETMQPLGIPGPSGIPLDGTFLRAVPPNNDPANPLVSPDLTPCTRAPCTPLTVSVTSGTAIRTFPLLAAMSGSDGATYFIDVLNRRFVSSAFFALNTNPTGLNPTVDVPPQLNPAQTTAPPTLAIDPNSLQAGVTHRGRWRAVWHSPVPGLDRRAGTVTPNPDGTLLFKTPPADLNRWTGDPAIHLGPGDVVSFAAYAQSDPSLACQQLISTESALRFELTILSVAGDSLLLSAPDPSINFKAAGCPAFGAVAQVRTGGTQPWLLFEGNTVRGRALPDGTFTAHARRFDYPLNYDANTLPLAASDVAFRLTVSGAPSAPVGGFTFAVADNNTVVSYRDNLITSGLASAVYAFSSPRVQSLVFSSITGANELLQGNPLLLSTSLQGVLVYR